MSGDGKGRPSALGGEQPDGFAQALGRMLRATGRSRARVADLRPEGRMKSMEIAVAFPVTTATKAAWRSRTAPAWRASPANATASYGAPATACSGRQRGGGAPTAPDVCQRPKPMSRPAPRLRRVRRPRGLDRRPALASHARRLDCRRRVAGLAIRIDVIPAGLRISASAPGGGDPAVWVIAPRAT
jgi:hypothetical protein